MSPLVLMVVYLFAIGLCVGSFLNVVIYRLPREKSLVHPPSACPSCGLRIRFYDNIPVFSWLVLRGKCRKCGAKISARYIVIELLTGLLFTGLFWYYFMAARRSFGFETASAVGAFFQGGWMVYVLHLILLTGLVAASAIDLELWIIPISLCWFVTAAGIVFSSLGSFVIPTNQIMSFDIFPMASSRVAALSLGAGLGLAVSLILLALRVIKPSYPYDSGQDTPAPGAEINMDNPHAQEQDNYNHRREVFKELVFLLPVGLGAVLAQRVLLDMDGIYGWWVGFSQHPVVSGILGSFWGYIVGCGVVWLTRILGTLGFGREAMGLGDVHLMGAAGVVIGPFMVTAAFFVAPFFGLAWAMVHVFFKKTREIPYGPFLSMGIITVMILHDTFKLFEIDLYLTLL